MTDISDGRIQVTYYAGGERVKPLDVFDEVASGTGIQRMYRERTDSDLGVQQIFEASQKGNDADAVQVMEIFLETFGQALGNLVMSLDPDVIVIGGGVSNLPILYKEGLQRVSVQVFQGRQNIRIVQNQLGDSSGVYGAAAAAGTTV